MTSEVVIPARFNGPPASGNGGYSCGLLAGFIDGPARIRLHYPPPLDTPLQVCSVPEGLSMSQGDTLIASARPVDITLEIPPPPTLPQAISAARGFACHHNHTFPSCFVCGPKRPGHDGLELSPGPVAGSDVYACSWQPATDLLDASGNVRPEIVWAALDCPGYFAVIGEPIRPAMLGELEAQIFAPVPGEQTLVVYAWPISVKGRKLNAGTAIATAEGRVLAIAHSTWILLQSE